MCLYLLNSAAFAQSSYFFPKKNWLVHSFTWTEFFGIPSVIAYRYDLIREVLKNWTTESPKCAKIHYDWLYHERRPKVYWTLGSTPIFPTWKRSALNKFQWQTLRKLSRMSANAKHHHLDYGFHGQRTFFCKKRRASRLLDSKPLKVNLAEKYY